MCTHNVYITKLRSSLWKRLSVSCFFTFFPFTLSPSLLFLLSFFLCLSRAFFCLFFHILFKSGCILHKLTRISARMTKIMSKNKRNRHEKACSSHLFRFLFLFRCNFFSIFFPFPFFFVSLCHYFTYGLPWRHSL